MIVSIAIAVFPVCLSPIISSRWPLPIGVRASIAVRPVWSGSWTDFLSMIPGAILSIGRVFDVSMFPLPSIGTPVGSIILPIKLSPTGIEAILPVDFTVIPSFIPV